MRRGRSPTWGATGKPPVSLIATSNHAKLLQYLMLVSLSGDKDSIANSSALGRHTCKHGQSIFNRFACLVDVDSIAQI